MEFHVFFTGGFWLSVTYCPPFPWAAIEFFSIPPAVGAPDTDTSLLQQQYSSLTVSHRHLILLWVEEEPGWSSVLPSSPQLFQTLSLTENWNIVSCFWWGLVLVGSCPSPPLFQIWNKRGFFLVEAKSRFPVLCCTGWVLALQCVPALSCLLPLLCWGAGAGDSCSERYLRGCFLQKTFSQFWGQLCYLFA